MSVIAFLRTKRTAARFSSLPALLVIAAGFLGAMKSSGEPASVLTNFTIDVWQAEQGLPGNTITSIAQTPDGYLWLGTFRGPVRFDGVRFETFGPDTPGLANERVTKLFADRRGDLWLTMEYGHLARYANGQFMTFLRSDGWPGERAYSFTEDSNGCMMVSTKDAAFVFKNGRFTSLCTNRVPAEWNFMQIISDAGGQTWITRDELLGTLSEDGWTPVPDGLALQRVLQIGASRSGGLWVCDQGKIRLLRDGGWAKDFGTHAWCADQSPGFLEDSRRRLWVSTYRYGLFCFAPDGSMQRFSRDTGLPENAVRAVHEDFEGNIWVGLNGGGLARIKTRVFTTYSRRGPLTNIVFGLAEDAKQRLWIGALEGGLWRMEGDRFAPVEISGLDRPWTAWTTFADRGAGVWIAAQSGAKGGLVRFHDETMTRYTTNAGLVHHDVLCLFESRDGSIWAGTEFGLSRFRDGQFSTYGTRDGLRGSSIRAIAEDTAGNLWLGTTGGGLQRWREGKFTTFKRQDGLASDSVQALLADADGTLWIGTSSGLSRLRGGRFDSFSRRDGLPANEIVTILDDGLGFLWLGTSRGVARVARTELDAFAHGNKRHLDCTTYLKADGLESIQCTSGGAPGLKTRDGRLWFATLGGLSVVDPRQIVANQIAPQLVIEDVLVDGTSRWSAGAAAQVPPGRRSLEVRYTGLSFSAPERVRFKHRLEGFDADWQEVGTRRAAYYQGLPPGKYRFHVTAANNDGVWNRAGATLALVVQPAFWQTLWFRALAVLWLLGSAFALYRRRVGVLEQRRAQQEFFMRQLLESQETERRRIASELHDSLGQDLVLVKNLALLGEQTQTTPGGAPNRFAEISTATARALDEVHAISYALRPPELDRLGLAKALAAMLRRAEDVSDIRFQRRLELEGPLAKGADIQLFRIAQEAVNNLVKHSGAKSARVELWQDEAGTHLVIADDGCGFSVAERSGKSGLGLVGIDERVQLLGGKHEVLSRPGRGTTLTVLVPPGIVGSTLPEPS